MEKPQVKKFSFETIEEFDTHICQSIPNYLLIHKAIQGLTDYFIEDGTNVYDLGCSKGTLLKKITNENKKKVQYYGIDISKNLLPKDTENINFMSCDLLSDKYNLSNSSLITSIFTLQFLPKKERLGMLKRIYDGLNKGGAFIITEKVYSNNSILQDINTSLYYQFKANNFKYDEIMAKEKDLRSMMKLFTKKENEDLFEQAGFKICDTFFQYYNFVGWILIK